MSRRVLTGQNLPVVTGRAAAPAPTVSSVRMRLASLLTASAFAVAACGGGEPAAIEATSTPTEPAPSSSTPSGTPDAGAPGNGPQVPEFLAFEAPDVRGGQVVGSDYAGQDLVIWFWAPW